MRVIFITPSNIANPRGGRAMLAYLHRTEFKTLLGDAVADHALTREGGVAHRLAGYIDGATSKGVADVVAAIDQHRADTIWLDGSNLGRIAQGVKRRRPTTRVVAFCHNVEARFFLGAFKRAKSARSAGVMIGNFVAERLTMRYSDDVIALSQRDSDGLRALYGRAADAILPMAMLDQASAPAGSHEASAPHAPLLFVGGAFYANQAGIAWFARHVAHHLPSTAVKVIGHRMEGMRRMLAATPTIHVVGTIDCLEPHYGEALAAIAPIFDGSGMKTKVAEALMFGKHVIGTPEAFSGYAADIVRANWCCSDAETMVAAIRHVTKCPPPAYDPAMRALYERDHSPAATRTRLARILKLDQATF